MSAVRGITIAWLAIALVFATAVGILPARPAFADHDDRGGRGHERGHQHWRRDEHRHYPVYAPPSVYYPRQASPGITLFIPLEIR
jgi:hypothetical protein